MVNRKLPVNLLHRRQIADGLRTKKWLARRTACGERHDEKRQQSQPYEALIHSRTNEQWRWRCSSRGHRRRDCGGAILASVENYEKRLRPEIGRASCRERVEREGVGERHKEEHRR